MQDAAAGKAGPAASAALFFWAGGVLRALWVQGCEQLFGLEFSVAVDRMVSRLWVMGDLRRRTGAFDKERV